MLFLTYLWDNKLNGDSLSLRSTADNYFMYFLYKCVEIKGILLCTLCTNIIEYKSRVDNYLLYFVFKYHRIQEYNELNLEIIRRIQG